MKTRNHLKAWIIFSVYLIATCALLLWGYSVQKPAVEQQEFPFTITYAYQGQMETISGVYVAEYCRDAKYIGDHSMAWFGYIKDHNRLELDYYRVLDFGDRLFSINLNINPGYLMGDPAYAGMVCQPTGQYNCSDDMEEYIVTDPAELEKLGFTVVDWSYPLPIENTFSFGGISLSGEGTVYTTAIAIAALLACMFLIRKDPKTVYSNLDRFGIVLNLLIAIIAFPFILIVSALSEIVADASICQQILYFTPALTALGIAASLTLRRLGYRRIGFGIKFVGLVIFALCVLIESL